MISSAVELFKIIPGLLVSFHISIFAIVNPNPVASKFLNTENGFQVPNINHCNRKNTRNRFQVKSFLVARLDIFEPHLPAGHDRHLATGGFVESWNCWISQLKMIYPETGFRCYICYNLLWQLCYPKISQFASSSKKSVHICELL